MRISHLIAQSSIRSTLLTALVLSILFAVIFPVSAETNVVLTNQAINLDNENQSIEAYNINGNNYLKLRDLAYILNGTSSQFRVGWDETTQTVDIMVDSCYLIIGNELQKGEDKSSTAQPSTQTIIINGQENSSLSVYNIGGYNYFKLRDLSSALDFYVNYKEDTQTVIIFSYLDQFGCYKGTTDGVPQSQLDAENEAGRAAAEAAGMGYSGTSQWFEETYGRNPKDGEGLQRLIDNGAIIEEDGTIAADFEYDF